MAYKSRKSRSTKKCPRGKKGVRSHKRKSGRRVKSYCRRSKRSYKKRRSHRSKRSKRSKRSYKKRGSKKLSQGAKDLLRRKGLSRTYRVPKGAAKKMYKAPTSFSSAPTFGTAKPTSPFLQRSPKVLASSSRPQALPAVEELGMDFVPLTERMRRRRHRY